MFLPFLSILLYVIPASLSFPQFSFLIFSPLPSSPSLLSPPPSFFFSSKTSFIPPLLFTSVWPFPASVLSPSCPSIFLFDLSPLPPPSLHSPLFYCILVHTTSSICPPFLSSSLFLTPSFPILFPVLPSTLLPPFFLVFPPHSSLPQFDAPFSTTLSSFSLLSSPPYYIPLFLLMSSFLSYDFNYFCSSSHFLLPPSCLFFFLTFLLSFSLLFPLSSSFFSFSFYLFPTLLFL